MIERAVEAERQSQHMSRAFTDRMDEMVEARAAEMTVEEAESLIEEESAEETPEDDAPAEVSEEVVEEAVEEDAPEEEVEAVAEEETEAPADETWNSDVDPWADN